MINRAGYNRSGWAMPERVTDQPVAGEFVSGRRVYHNMKNQQSHEIQNRRHPNPHHYSNLGMNHALDHGGGNESQKSLSMPVQRSQSIEPPQLNQSNDQAMIQEKSAELERLKQLLLERENEINNLRVATADQEGYQDARNQPPPQEMQYGGPQSYGNPPQGNPYAQQPQVRSSHSHQPSEVAQYQQPAYNDPQSNPYAQQDYGQLQQSSSPYEPFAGRYAREQAQQPPQQSATPAPDYGEYAAAMQSQSPPHQNYHSMPQMPGMQAAGTRPQKDFAQYMPQGYNAAPEQPPMPQAAQQYGEPQSYQPQAGYGQQLPSSYAQPPQQEQPPQQYEPQNAPPPEQANQMSAEQYAEYQERLSKDAFDRHHKESRSQELVNNLEAMNRFQENQKSQARLKQDKELQQRLEHLRQLEEEDQREKAKRAQAQRLYKEHLDMQERSRAEIHQKEDMIEERSLNRKDQDLYQHQPGQFNPANHLYMFGPNGGNQNQVMFTKKLPKTLCFNPITGHMKDTNVYHPSAMAPEEAKEVSSSLVGPQKQQTNFVAPYAAHEAFQQPKFTKAHPKVQFHNPITGQVGRPIEYLQGDMDVTSYSLEFGKRQVQQSQLQEYGNMAMRNN